MKASAIAKLPKAEREAIDRAACELYDKLNPAGEPIRVGKMECIRRVAAEWDKN